MTTKTSKGSAKPEIRTCVDCGAKFTPKNVLCKRCPECSLKNQMRKGKSSSNRGWGKVADINTIDPALIGHGICRFCGRPTKKNAEFCHYCMSEGYHNVYLVTGKTNGWDRKRRTHVRIEDGWRGNKVCGGRSIDHKSKV